MTQENPLDNALYQWAGSTIPTRDVLFANTIDGNAPAFCVSSRCGADRYGIDVKA